MADYKETDSDIVLRTVDQAFIPNDPANYHRQQYEAWLADGGVPDPYVPPVPASPAPTVEQEVAFDHENRIRALEGQPPLTMGDFIAKMGNG